MKKSSGLLIPNKVRYLKNIITCNNVFLLSLLYDLESKKLPCDYDNEYISNQIGCCQTRIPKLIKELKKLDFITIQYLKNKRFIYLHHEIINEVSEIEKINLGGMYE